MRKLSNWVFTLILILIVYLIYVGQTAAYNRPYWHYGTLTKLVPIEYEDVEIVKFRDIEDPIGYFLENLGPVHNIQRIIGYKRYNANHYLRDFSAMIGLIGSEYLWTEFIEHLPHLSEEEVEKIQPSNCNDFVCVTTSLEAENNVLGLRASAVKAHQDKLIELGGEYIHQMDYAVYADRDYRIGNIEIQFYRPRAGATIGNYFVYSLANGSVEYKDYNIGFPTLIGAMTHEVTKEDGELERLNIAAFKVTQPECSNLLMAFVAYNYEPFMIYEMDKVEGVCGWTTSNDYSVERIGNQLQFTKGQVVQSFTLPGNIFN